MTENVIKPEKYTINGIDSKSFGQLLLHTYFYIENTPGRYRIETKRKEL
jgi:hypothetical protein